MTEGLTARQRWIRRIDNLLARSFNLAISTGAEVLTVVEFDESIHHYATDALDPMINQDAGRKLLIKLLSPDPKAKPAAQQPSMAAAPEPVDPEFPEIDTDNTEFVTDVDKRELAFKEQTKLILAEAEAISVLRRPQKKTEVLVLIATPAQKVVSWATPKLEPLIRTEHGQALLSSLLATNSLLQDPPQLKPTEQEKKQ